MRPTFAFASCGLTFICNLECRIDCVITDKIMCQKRVAYNFICWLMTVTTISKLRHLRQFMALRSIHTEQKGNHSLPFFLWSFSLALPIPKRHPKLLILCRLSIHICDISNNNVFPRHRPHPRIRLLIYVQTERKWTQKQNISLMFSL